METSISAADAIGESPKRPLFDWRNPHYAPIWARRIRVLSKLRDPDMGARNLQAMVQYYRAGHIDAMIEDHGVTYDPRNAGTGKPILMPFILFPRQRENIAWLWSRFKAQQDGIEVKSRDCGASWIFMAFCICLCRLFDNVSCGIGSRKEDLVDRSGDPDCLFWKGRQFIKFLPKELRGGWDIKRNNAHMRTWFSDTGSSITGEAGDDIGRGGRKTIYGVDEFAFVERPKLVDAALSANTNCRIEISTVNGLANTFAERARGGQIDRFDYDYHDDPRKCNQGPPVEVTWDAGDGRGPLTYRVGTREPWPDFAAKLAKMDPTVKAAEYDRDFMASVEGVIIPQVWVQAAIGAAERMGWPIEGVRRAVWDLADAGKDFNANGFRHGCQLEDADEWKGMEDKMMDSVRRTFEFAGRHRANELYYDKDGMGGPAGSMIATVHEEVRPKDMTKAENRRYTFTITGFQGSGAVIDPESFAPGTERLNGDYFQNYKAQSWMALRWRFWNTFLAVSGEKYDPDWTISLNPRMKLLSKLTGELSQPVRKWSVTGKMVVDKTPDDVASPNLADMCMMAFCYQQPVIAFSWELLESLQRGE